MNQTVRDLRTIAEQRLFREYLHDPIAEFTWGSAAISAIIDDCNQLAERAFDKGELEAKVLAERLLYDLQIGYSYTSPTQALPGLVWGILIRAKLRNVFKLCGRHGPARFSEMVKILETAVDQEEQQDKDVLNTICASGRDVLRIFTKNWFNSARAFEKHMIALLQRAPEATHKSIIGNISDEFINGPTHQSLRLRWGAEFGVNHSVDDPLDDKEYFVESFAILSYRTALSVLHDPCFGLGCFYAQEALFPRVSKILYNGLRTQGFKEESLEFWQLHSVADLHHAQEWLQCLKDSNLTPDQCGIVIDGAITQWAVRRKMMDRFKKLVAKAA